jgi:hypothetical protein
MARKAKLEKRVLKVLERLKDGGIVQPYYLAGGTALTMH